MNKKNKDFLKFLDKQLDQILKLCEEIRESSTVKNTLMFEGDNDNGRPKNEP